MVKCPASDENLIEKLEKQVISHCCGMLKEKWLINGIMQAQSFLMPTLCSQSGKFGSAPVGSQEGKSHIQNTEEAAEHENMKAVLKSSSPDEGVASTVPGLRTRTRGSTIRGQFF